MFLYLIRVLCICERVYSSWTRGCFGKVSRLSVRPAKNWSLLLALAVLLAVTGGTTLATAHDHAADEQSGVELCDLCRVAGDPGDALIVTFGLPSPVRQETRTLPPLFIPPGQLEFLWTAGSRDPPPDSLS
jgi:hypothetical protein